MLVCPCAKRGFDSHVGCSPAQRPLLPDNSVGNGPSCFHLSSPDTDYCLFIIFANQRRILVRCPFMSSDLRFILSPATTTEPSVLPGHHSTHLWLAAFSVPMMDIWSLHQSPQYPSHPWSLKESDLTEPCWKCRGWWTRIPMTDLLSIQKAAPSSPIPASSFHPRTFTPSWSVQNGPGGSSVLCVEGGKGILSAHFLFKLNLEHSHMIFLNFANSIFKFPVSGLLNIFYSCIRFNVQIFVVASFLW